MPKFCQVVISMMYGHCPYFLNPQVNEETGNRRPVMLTLLRVPRVSKSTKEGNGQELERTLEEGKEVESKPKEEKANGRLQVIARLGCLESSSGNCIFRSAFSFSLIR